MLDAVGTVIRFALAVVWLVAGSIKLADPARAYVAVRGYQLLPDSAVSIVATALPLVEVVLGLLLLAGLGTRLLALCSSALLVAFIAAVAQAWARGLSIDCGCFGGGGEVRPDATSYPREIALDVGLLALSVWLVVRPCTRWTARRWLYGGERTGEQVDAGV